MLFTVARLEQIYAAFFSKIGIPEDELKILTRCVMSADLRGVHAQGIHHLPMICHLVQDGTWVPRAPFQIISEDGCTALVDGNKGIGPVVATKAMELAIKKALNQGLGCTVVRNGNDIGMTANYTMMAISHGCIGIATTHGTPKVAPWGAREPFFATNPISIAIPAREKYPIVIDMATSVVARGKIVHAAEKGEKIPEGWAIDRSGKSTTDPNEALKGALLTFGGYKGYGLAIVADALSGALAGLSMARAAKAKRPTNSGQFYMAIRIASFSGDFFKDAIDELISEIKSSQRMPGFSEILLPGEQEYRTEEKSRGIGVEIPDFLWENVKKLAHELNVNI
ncbi:MAG: Ldh family oxidoreductase [Candidatus Bathyarchaeia archaeon]|jgi:LDH2 family malate/lactate/ureidoglycolate dehydrogenase